MSDDLTAVKVQLSRQVAHWRAAALQLSDLSNLASASGWRALERDLGLAIESTLQQAIVRLLRESSALEAQQAAAESGARLARLQADLLAFRERYLATESTLELYGDAVNSRTNARLGAYLRACDLLAVRALERGLGPLGRKPPHVLTYLDPGLGASILKAGLRLWDGAVTPVAAIKIARHNLYRPTSLLHEVGHQFAHEVGWNQELAQLLSRGLARHGEAIAETWAGWTSELSADMFAFALGGFGAVAALCDVLSGDPTWVLSHVPADPHPVGYLRVLLGRAMCQRFFGSGPWDALADAFQGLYRPGASAVWQSEGLARSLPLLPEIVELLFFAPCQSLDGRCFAQLLDPSQVRPDALAQLAARNGAALLTSDFLIERECLGLVALSAWRAATARDVRGALQEQAGWMTRLGELAAARKHTERS